MSQRGDSGTNLCPCQISILFAWECAQQVLKTYHMKRICIAEGAAWSREGIRQAHVLSSLKIPYVILAATILPRNQEALKSEVRTARSLGYPSSPIKAEAATIANGIPSPRSQRAIMNMTTIVL